MTSNAALGGVSSGDAQSNVAGASHPAMAAGVAPSVCEHGVPVPEEVQAAAAMTHGAEAANSHPNARAIKIR